MGLLESLVAIMDMIGKYGVPLVLSGVMVFVLIYLLKVMLPAKDKAHEGALAAKDAQHAAELKLARADFREALERILAHCLRETAFRDEVLKKEMAEMSAAVVDFRRTLEEFREELVEARAQRRGKS